MPNKSIILLQACGHNPTGADPTENQWRELLNLIKVKEIFPFIDISYQGICSNNLEKDAFCVQELLNEGVEMLIAQSFSKLMSLYGERVGALTFKTNNKQELEKIVSQLEIIIRSNYSNPPIHGSSIASFILNDSNAKSIWINELKEMHDRMKLMRNMLYLNLKKEGSSLDWRFLIENKGMFSFTGLNEIQVIFS